VVSLQAAPAAGWSFANWSGDANGADNPIDVTITGNMAVTANYSQNEYTLTVNSIGNGSVTKNPNQATYHYGDPVSLTAVPDADWAFSAWSGGLTGSANPASLNISGNTTVTATFTQNQYTLTITSIHGSVSRNPDKANYAAGEVVQLTATPDPGWSFTSWSGDASGTDNPIDVTISGNMAVTANYSQNEYTLTVISDHGTVTRTPAQATYHLNDVVTLQAAADTDWTFTGWSGDATGTANPIDVTITGNMTVTANYAQNVITHSISLMSGWNLISFNVHPASTAISTVLSSIAGNYDLVYAWDATGGHSTSGNWVKFDPNAPPYSNTLSAVDEKMGIWIHMTAADTLDVSGSAPGTSAIDLRTNANGWNLVAYPSTAESDMPAALSENGVGTDFSLVYAYHANDSDPWKLYDRSAPEWSNDLTRLSPGWAYWIKVSANNTWSVIYQP
jgi:uncharacterized repeat protein (TIGR02543 family)